MLELGTIVVRPAEKALGWLTVGDSEIVTDRLPWVTAAGITCTRWPMTIVPNSSIEIDQAQNHMFYFAPGVSLQDIVTSVNEVGAAPGDLMAILEALKEAGALRAELVVI